MRTAKRFFFTAAIAILAVTAARPRICLAGITDEERRLNLDSFEFVWKTIGEAHFDTTFGGLDWQAVHDELRPKMEEAKNAREARAILADLISRLRLSHFNIIPASVYENIDAPAKAGDRGGSTGIDLRVAQGKAYVTRVSPGTPAERAGIAPGWEIRSVGGTKIPPLFPPIEREFKGNPRREYYLTAAVRSRLGGAIGDTVSVVFRDRRNRTVEKALVLEEPVGKKVVFGSFPPFYLTHRADTLRGGVGYFTFSSFFDPVTLMPAFGDAMSAFMDSPGIVIDVRGNPGGIGGMTVGMAGWFVDEKNLYMGTMRTRENTYKFVINPRKPAYRGPVAILVDGLSGSSSEIFAGGVQGLPRVRVFGSRTMGATLPSLAERLPNGDGFQYAIASFIARNGEELEGRGVIPDVEVGPTAKSLRAGRDPALEAAIDWLLGMEYK